MYQDQTGDDAGGGRYVFADVAAIDSIITKLEKIRDDIRDDGRMLNDALRFVESPARDLMSGFQAEATSQSLTRAIEHNDAMLRYAESELEKLGAAKTSYEVTDAESAYILQRAADSQ